MLNLNNVYNYYSMQMMTPLGSPRRTNNNNKKDDLKTVYNNMVRENKNSPFYKFSLSDTSQNYAINLKEAALSLESESKSLSGDQDDFYNQLTAVSENENIVYATLNDKAAEGLPSTLAIKVDSLATAQTNVGNYLSSGERSINPGEYSFGITVGSKRYSFHVNVQKGDTNELIQRNLADAINHQDLGIRASVRNNRVDGTSALTLKSESVGEPGDGDLYFSFDENYLENSLVPLLGVDQIDTPPSNAEFFINDSFHTSISNRISLNHSMDIDLLSINEEPVNINLVPDNEKISDKLKSFVDSYNHLVDIARTSSTERSATKLYRDVTSMATRHSENLRNVGVNIEENGYLKIEEEVDPSEIQKLFDENLSDFRKDIKRTAEKMSINPLNYIDKVVVTYPNTTNNYPNPYTPSRYSGLMFNDYA